MTYMFDVKVTEESSGTYTISTGETDISIGDFSVKVVVVHCCSTHRADLNQHESLKALISPFSSQWHRWLDETTIAVLIGGPCNEGTLLDISMGNPLHKIR